ncbi:hypothetical protein ACFO0M_22600 [Micromonospora mangrovi]|uniref:Uncharacterized protein n=2 Tax=Micromonospora TaxID=1873 RepID=A0AAU8H966_9ACTN
MPEELTEEQTRAAFALLRAESLTHIRTPGTAEALRTVRRRRRAGIATAAAGVALALAGSAGVASLVGGDRSAPPPVSSTPSTSPPPLSTAQLDALASEAGTALGINSIDNRKRRSEGKGPILMSSSGPILRGGPSNISGTGYNENKTGVYVLEILCVGEGALRARFWGEPAMSGARESRPTPSPDSPDVRVPCGDHPTPVTASVRAPWPARVYVSVEADPTAVGRAAYARLVRVP